LKEEQEKEKARLHQDYKPISGTVLRGLKRDKEAAVKAGADPKRA